MDFKKEERKETVRDFLLLIFSLSSSLDRQPFSTKESLFHPSLLSSLCGATGL